MRHTAYYNTLTYPCLNGKIVCYNRWTIAIQYVYVKCIACIVPPYSRWFHPPISHVASLEWGKPCLCVATVMNCVAHRMPGALYTASVGLRCGGAFLFQVVVWIGQVCFFVVAVETDFCFENFCYWILSHSLQLSETVFIVFTLQLQ